MRRLITLCFLAAGLPGCMVPPSLDYEGPAVSDIVQRVRCELAMAIPLPQEDNDDYKSGYPSSKYQWLRDWTAKVDLTLQTVEKADLNVSTSFIQPLAKIGQVAQQFTVGAGVTASGTADRTGKVSFTVAMTELMHLKGSPECETPAQRGLLGKLGLREWILSALIPVEDERLVIGYHDQPGKTSKIASPRGPTPASKPDDSGSLPSDNWTAKVNRIKNWLDGAIQQNIEGGRKRITEGEKEILKAQRSANDAQASALQFRKQTVHRSAVELRSEEAKKLMRLTYVQTRSALRTAEFGSATLDVAKVYLFAAKIDIAGAKKEWGDIMAEYLNPGGTEIKKKLKDLSDAELDEFLIFQFTDPTLKDKMIKEYKEKIVYVKKTFSDYDDKDRSPIKGLETRMKEDGEVATSATKIANDAWAILPQSAPLDSIVHTLKFTVVASANITPNWTLERFKGPGLSAPFANAQSTRFHTLDLVLGAPGTPGGKDLSPEQQRQLLSLRLEALKVLVVPGGF